MIGRQGCYRASLYKSSFLKGPDCHLTCVQLAVLVMHSALLHWLMIALSPSTSIQCCIAQGWVVAKTSRKCFCVVCIHKMYTITCLNLRVMATMHCSCWHLTFQSQCLSVSACLSTILAACFLSVCLPLPCCLSVHRSVCLPVCVAVRLSAPEPRHTVCMYVQHPVICSAPSYPALSSSCYPSLLTISLWLRLNQNTVDAERQQYCSHHWQQCRY